MRFLWIFGFIAAMSAVLAGLIRQFLRRTKKDEKLGSSET